MHHRSMQFPPSLVLPSLAEPVHAAIDHRAYLILRDQTAT